VFKIKLIFICLCAYLLISRINAVPWEKVLEKNGISVFSREHVATGLYEFRGRGMVYAAPGKIISMLQDIKYMTKWVEGCVSSSVLEKNFTGTSFDMDFSNYRMVIHAENSIPWPFENRDYVLKGRVAYNSDTDTAFMLLETTTHPARPVRDGIVRMDLMKISFSIKPMNQDKHSMIDFYVHLDPGGNIPHWVVNFMTKNEPYKSITKLRELVKSDKYDKSVEELVNFHLKKLRNKNFQLK